MASATAKDPRPPAAPRGQSQWELIAREFRKRRLAVAASLMILFLVTVSIFAPLLANDRPICYVGVNRFEFLEAARTLRGAMGQVIEARTREPALQTKSENLTIAARARLEEIPTGAPPDMAARLGRLADRTLAALADSDRPRSLRELKDVRRRWSVDFPEAGFRPLIDAISQVLDVRTQQDKARTTMDDFPRTAGLQIRLMSAALPATSAAKVRELGQRILQTFREPDPAKQTEELRSHQQDVRSTVEGLDAELLVRTRWPVFASLIGSDIAFLVANLMLLAWPVWSRVLRRWEGPAGDGANAWWPAAILVGLPLVCGLTWWLVVPQRVDRTDYKSGVLGRDDLEKKAPVVFQSVVWPSVAYGLDEIDLVGKTRAPAWYKQAQANPDSKPISRWSGPHWLGTDELGRDILCRMIWGGRISLSVGIVAVAIYVSIGVVVGSLAGYFRGVCDLILSRIIEVVICFPAFFLILTIVAMIGPGLFNIMVVIGLTGWTGIARLVRGEFLRLVDQEFVLAGRALGYSPLRLIFRHVLPNALAPVLVSATFGVAGAILTESALSFLGLGITVPTPSWGGILADGRTALLRAPWLIHFPGLAIFLTITSYNLVGEALRDAADPRLRGSR